MKAKINHGNRGTKVPPKDYGETTWTELMLDSLVNGHLDQVIYYFNRMKRDEQINFLLNDTDLYGQYGDECRRVIIESM